MQSSSIFRCALSLSTAAALLSACGASQLMTGTLGPIPQHSTFAGSSTSNYRIVYNFGAPPDGNEPDAVLKYVNGTLFGTTTRGGSYDCSYGTGFFFGCGTVFGITTDGTEKMLHAFTVGDGADPESGLIEVKGTLYGTTYHGGGAGSEGAAYGITTAGSETVLHGFHQARLSPENPEAGLVYMDGVFYGTTLLSGPRKPGEGTFGTVFTVTPAGAFHILYRFKGGSDGAAPGSLIDVNHMLYGITHQGGTSNSGTVYRITTAGVEHVIYRFKGRADGTYPDDGLLDVNGTLYGATGQHCPFTFQNCGTIYSITTSGKEKLLYSFTGGADGAQPNGNLVDVNGVLYGTTSEGGTYNQGTVFSVTLGGIETVLHSFSGYPDGGAPGAGLIDVKNTLYGTTQRGGLVACGYRSSPPVSCGTVFALTLSKPFYSDNGKTIPARPGSVPAR